MFRLPQPGDDIRTQPRFYNPGPETGEGWTVPVLKGAGLARPPVPVRYFGTVATKDDRKDRGKKHARAEKNREALNQAVFILSQSETGRLLLKGLTDKNYRIVFDDDRMNAGSMTGLCDPAKKLILLSGAAEVETLVLVLAHEAAHVMQNEEKNLFPTSGHSPEAGIRLSFAIEADAYAHQMQVALELCCGDSAGPANQVIFPGVLARMHRNFPRIARAAEAALRKDPGALRNGGVMAAGFLAFYEDSRMKKFYEDMHMDFCDNFAARHARGSATQSFSLAGAFSRDAGSEWIKERINHRGLPYLKTHLPALDLCAMPYSGLHLETAQRIAKFYRDHLPARQVPRLKIRNAGSANQPPRPKPGAP